MAVQELSEGAEKGGGGGEGEEEEEASMTTIRGWMGWDGMGWKKASERASDEGERRQ